LQNYSSNAKLLYADSSNVRYRFQASSLSNTSYNWFTTSSSKLSDTCGYASISDGGTIAHGLGTIPKWVGITPSGTNPIAYSFKVDSTNITVYHTASSSEIFSWRVKR
jgi:hypothetical protein